MSAILVALVFPRAQAGVQPSGPDADRARRLRGRAHRRPAARRSPHRRGLRRRGPVVCRRLLGLERPGRKAARRPAASHHAPRRQERRWPLRYERRLCRQDDAARGHDVARRLALRRRAAEHLEADRHQWRRRRGRARGVVQGRNADRLRQRSARTLSRPRRLDLLDQGRLRPADARAARQAGARDPRRARPPAAAGRSGDRSGDDRRHGQSRRRRLHAVGRAHRQRDVPRASTGGQARRPHPRRLRRRVRQAAQRRSTVTRGRAI